MKSIKEIFTSGYGPSSSHTMGPSRAATYYRKRHLRNVDSFRVTLYGSLALTGKGHGTDSAITRAMNNVVPNTEIEFVWKKDEFLPKHPNGMLFEAMRWGESTDAWEVYSVGGGVLWDEKGTFATPEVYKESCMSDILTLCEQEGYSFADYVLKNEGPEITTYLNTVWEQMQKTVEAGLQNEGVLPGPLKLTRKAPAYYVKSLQQMGSSNSMGLMFAAALATSEENAAGGIVTTAPTCGASGVLPAVLYFMKHDQKMPDFRIIRGLATAGLVGTIVKTNGSISGAEVGCQGELGTACAMAAAAATQIWGGSPRQIEYAAEMGFEHNLGLTCDPVGGYVQIPCIERNAFVSQKARECALFALFSDGNHKVSFDDVVKTMMETGKDMQAKYRETGLGGLANVCALLKAKCNVQGGRDW